MTAPVVDTAAPAVAPPAPPAAPLAVVPAAAPPLAAPAAVPPTPVTTLAPTPARIPETPPAETDFSRDAVLARRLEAIKKETDTPVAADPLAAPDGQSPDSAAGTPTPPVGTVSPPATPEAPAAPQYIKVPIPEGHPLREGGATYLLAENEQQARAARATINDYTRRSQVETLRAQVDQFERQVAEGAARQQAQDEWRSSPEYATRMQQVQEVRDAFGDAVADVFAKGIDADYQRLESGKIEAALGEINQRRQSEAAQSWISDARVRVTALPEPIRSLPKFGEWFDAAIQSFNAELALGHFPQLVQGDTEAMHQEFLRFFNTRIRAQPEITALVNTVNARAAQQQTETAAKIAADAKEVERIEQEGVQKYLKSVADSRLAVPPHPLGTVQPATARDRTPAGSEAATSVVAAPSEPISAREAALASARERARLAGLSQGR
jgi:hypothetical protein